MSGKRKIIGNVVSTTLNPEKLKPHIGENGNWWIGDKDTGVDASGGSDEECITVDSEFSTTSTNPVQNKVITEKVTEIETTVGNIDILLKTI